MPRAQRPYVRSGIFPLCCSDLTTAYPCVANEPTDSADFRDHDQRRNVTDAMQPAESSGGQHTDISERVAAIGQVARVSERRQMGRIREGDF